MTPTEIFDDSTLDNHEKLTLQVVELLKDFPRDKGDFWETAKRYQEHFHELLTKHKIATILSIPGKLITGEEVISINYEPLRPWLFSQLYDLYGNVLEEIEDEFPVPDED
jgi:hypothetical protein